MPHPGALGGERYRVGSIEVDKRQNRFTVPGRILRDEPPLGFLAVTRGGFKGYESLLEPDTNAFEFNTACLLIGLNPDKGKPPTRHFDPAPTEGDPVEIDVDRRMINVAIDPAELERRKAGWQPPTPRYKTGVMAKYANAVSSASRGAVTV